MLPNLGWGELTVILVIVLVLFGGKRLPGLAKSLGQSLNIFKKSVQGEVEENPSDKDKID